MKKLNYGAKQAKKDLPFRRKTDNKTQGGKCLVIAGSAGQWGAAILCAHAVARSGAGYTYLFDSKKTFPTLKFPDFLIKYQKKDLSGFRSIAIGPGLKDKNLIKTTLRELSQIKFPAVVVDAEALNVISQMKKPLFVPSSWILTPHEGEMARLLKIPSSQIKSSREKSVVLLQKKIGGIILLKGAPTLITDGRFIIKITSGNSALAKAGTGDVLTGIIAGLLSQNVSPLSAACLGAYIHGSIADKWLQSQKDHLSLLASDLIEQLPSALYSLRKPS